MKVVILAGGMGSRLSEETDVRPKPMVEIGGQPILWHIMKHYAHHGYKDFVICLGYKGEYIKRYFADAVALAGNMTIDFANGTVLTDQCEREDWRVALVETGLNSTIGGRIRAVRDVVGDERFFLTYGDGVSDVDLPETIAFHESHGCVATMTAVHPVARFGHMEMEGDLIVEFVEKPQMAEGWINGGFFVLEPAVFEYLAGDTDWDVGLQRLATGHQLAAYRHEGFWQCMDTLRDKVYLNGLWDQGKPPWRTWA